MQIRCVICGILFLALLLGKIETSWAQEGGAWSSPPPIFERIEQEHWFDQETSLPAGAEEQLAGWEEWEELKQNPIDLNQAQAQDLKRLPYLSEFQILQFLLFRHRQGGTLSHLYLLKNIPSWNSELVINLLPFITLTHPSKPSLLATHAKGQWHLYQALVPKPSTRFVGDRLTFRTGIESRNSHGLHMGVLYKKSAGEAWFIHRQPHKPQFLSGFVQQQFSNRWLQHIILGDYKVRMGAGLICNQSAWGIESDAIGGSLLRHSVTPHHSSNEWHFFRGLALGGRLSSAALFSFFISSRPIDAARLGYTISRIHTTGLLRIPEEEALWHSSRMHSLGGRLSFQYGSWQIGVNTIVHSWGRNRLSYLPGYKQWQPNRPMRFSANTSVDHAYYSSSGRWQWTGETAWTPQGGWGTMHELVWRTIERGSYSVLVRYLSPHYQSLYGMASTHFSRPGNERGLRLRAAYPLTDCVSIQGMCDLFSSLKPRYRQTYRTQGVAWQGQIKWQLSPYMLLSGRYNYLRSNTPQGTARQTLLCQIGYIPPQGLSCYARAAYKRHSLHPGKHSYLLGMQGGYLWQTPSKVQQGKVLLSLYYFDAPVFALAHYPYLSYVTYGAVFVPLYGRGVLCVVGGKANYKRWKVQAQYNCFPWLYNNKNHALPALLTTAQVALSYTF